MVLYEVNLQIDPEIYEAYQSWLPEHIKALLTLPGFISAECFEVDSAREESPKKQISVLYRLSDRASLDRYLTEDAPRMRKAATDLFGSQFQATRRIMTLAEKFSKN